MPTSSTDLSAEERLVQAFEANEGQALNGAASLGEIRREAISRFSTLGLPGPKSEAYKYSPVTRALRHEYEVNVDAEPEHGVTESDVDDLLLPGLDAHIITLVNGRFDADLSRIGDLPDGVIARDFHGASAEHADLISEHFAQYADHRERVFVALNTAFTKDGAFVYVPNNTILEKPIHVLNVTSTDRDLFIQPRNLVIAEQSASATVIETDHTLTDSQTFTNAVTEIAVGANAHVDHYKVQAEGENASQVNNISAYQTRDSLFSTTTFTLSGRLVRNNLHITADAENCESRLYGLFMGRDEMHVDNSTLVDHTMPNCMSDELYKGILDDDATGVFNGKVFVHRDAQNIKAYQSNDNILLTNDADIYTKPELEIYADDVQCSHGATSGQLDEEAMFYLRSRGLSRLQAQSMLLVAFAGDIVDHVEVEPLREVLSETVTERFAETSEAATRWKA